MTASSKQFVRLEALIPIIRECLDGGQTVSFSPRGVSMLPMLRQGMDTVELAEIRGRLKKYDLPLYQRENGQYVLHRIVKAGETYTCVGDNQFLLEPGLRQEQMIAVVTAFTRDGKRIEVSNAGYQLYCRFWHYSRPIRRVWRKIRSLLGRIKRSLF